MRFDDCVGQALLGWQYTNPGFTLDLIDVAGRVLAQLVPEVGGGHEAHHDEVVGERHVADRGRTGERRH